MALTYEANVGNDQESQDLNKDNNDVHKDSVSLSNNNNRDSLGERQSKRARRTRTDTGPGSEGSIMLEPSTPEPGQTIQQQSSVSSNINNAKKTGATALTGKKKKRKTRKNVHQQQQQQSQPQQQQKDDSPTRDEEIPIDPDEPTYCLCDQISYGEMIMCDNDLCPFEWFHFSCVSLGVKPKGKWYCPKCRGDRSSVMKPKAQFLKELEKINKEKEQMKEGGNS